jgi:uncharacterized protein (TIGR03382 family)
VESGKAPAIRKEKIAVGEALIEAHIAERLAKEIAARSSWSGWSLTKVTGEGQAEALLDSWVAATAAPANTVQASGNNTGLLIGGGLLLVYLLLRRR